MIKRFNKSKPIQFRIDKMNGGAKGQMNDIKYSEKRNLFLKEIHF